MKESKLRLIKRVKREKLQLGISSLPIYVKAYLKKNEKNRFWNLLKIYLYERMFFVWFCIRYLPKYLYIFLMLYT